MSRYVCANCGQGGLGMYGHSSGGGFTCERGAVLKQAVIDSLLAAREADPTVIDKLAGTYKLLDQYITKITRSER